mgnify:CR=1 FL=1
MLLQLAEFKEKLCYAVYRNEKDYLSSTVLATAQAIKSNLGEKYQAVVFIDGLPKSEIRWFGTKLRHLGVNTEKVRGVRKEESDSLMRLADAICGFVREASEGNSPELQELLKKGLIKEYLRQV